MSPRTNGGARKATPVQLAEIANYALIIPSRPHAMRMAVEHALASVGCKIRVALEIESISAIIELVGQGYGHAVLPMTAVHSSTWSESLVARPVANPGCRARCGSRRPRSGHAARSCARPCSSSATWCAAKSARISSDVKQVNA